MPNQEVRCPSDKRSHIVVIPGFAGFDALGQLEYYRGLTNLFDPYRSQNGVLHYFDNFPTAAVVTRATRLREYLAKRIARGEIFNADEISLVGHSTGGLDIRRLLWDLWHLADGENQVRVEGGEKVNAKSILDRVRRVIFLSVPHWGTNIADWVQAHGSEREALITYLRTVVEGSQVPLVEPVESAVAAIIASFTRAELLQAVKDALDEASANKGKPSPFRTAEAHEAASELALYLRHMACDFRAIADLTSYPPRTGERADPETLSPAHFNPKERKKEIERLRGIEFLSYVTIGRRVYPFNPGEPVPQWEFAKSGTYPKLFEDGGSTRGTDILYRVCYRACAGGPFQPPKENCDRAKELSSRDLISVWDNDGIVNTLSMFWPVGRNVLVRADHMDIVGHYHPQSAPPDCGRTYQTYDLLRSRSGFGKAKFEHVWKEIFSFCVARPQVTQALAAKAGG